MPRQGEMINVHASMVILALVVCWGCSNEPTSPPGSGSARVLVTSDVWAGGRTVLSLVGTAPKPERSSIVRGSLESAALVADNTLLMGVVHQNAQRDLVAVDALTLRERWRTTVSNALVATAQSGVGLRAVTSLTASRDGKSVYVAQAVQSGTVGIARLNSLSGVAEAFSGPWLVGGSFCEVPSFPGRSDGAIAMVASRENAAGGPLRLASIYLLDRLSLTPFDSISFSELGGARVVLNLLVLKDGASLLIGTDTEFLVFDLLARRVVASRQRPGLGAVVLFPNSSRFAALDQGRFPELAGSGMVYLFDDQLAAIDSIDVSTPLGGSPHSPLATVMGNGVVDDATGELYVRTGSAPFGSLYPVQPARVIVLSLAGRRVDRIIPLVGDNFGFAYLLPR